MPPCPLELVNSWNCPDKNLYPLLCGVKYFGFLLIVSDDRATSFFMETENGKWKGWLFGSFHFRIENIGSNCNLSSVPVAQLLEVKLQLLPMIFCSWQQPLVPCAMNELMIFILHFLHVELLLLSHGLKGQMLPNFPELKIFGPEFPELKIKIGTGIQGQFLVKNSRI